MVEFMGAARVSMRYFSWWRGRDLSQHVVAHGDFESDPVPVAIGRERHNALFSQTFSRLQAIR